MNFLNPLLLLGLAAMAIPVAIHLINRRRAVRRPFPAMTFLLKSQKRLARRLKVRQWLLLALRIGAMALIPLAMARPYLVAEVGEGDGDRTPTDVVFLVDDSASMGHDDGAAWKRAVDAVSDRVGNLRSWDRGALLFASAWPAGAPLGEDAPIPELTDAHADLLDAVSSHTPGARGTDLARALRTGNDILAGSEQGRRTLVLVSDLQASGLDPQNLPVGGLMGQLEVIDVGAPAPRANLTIVEASTTQQSSGPRPELTIDATVRNHGPDPANGVELQLWIEGERIAAGLIDIPAGGTATKTFTHRFDTKGLHRAQLKLADGADALAADNVYHLPIQLAQRVRVLMVNGDPRSVVYQDELFYLERALFPSASSSSGIVPQSTGVDGIASFDFADFDVVVLANVEKLPRAEIGKLERFVDGGGGLLFLSGSLVNPEVYNTLFRDLLPKPLRSVKRLATRDDPDAPVKITRMGQIDRRHPVFKVFDLPGGESLQTVPVYSYVLLEPTTSGDAKIVLSYADGAPALLERQRGDGRVALLTTTVDRDWTDLPLKPAFLPLMRRMVRYLGRRSTSASRTDVHVGDKVALDPSIAQGRVRIEVRDPDGQRIVPAPESTEPGAPLTFIARTPGHYEVVAVPEDGGDPRQLETQAFAVNLDPREGDLKPLDVAALRDKLAAATSGPEGSSGASAAPVAPERRVGIWSIILFVVTLMLLAETVLGTRRSVLAKLVARLRGREGSDELKF